MGTMESVLESLHVDRRFIRWNDRSYPSRGLETYRSYERTKCKSILWFGSQAVGGRADRARPVATAVLSLSQNSHGVSGLWKSRFAWKNASLSLSLSLTSLGEPLDDDDDVRVEKKPKPRKAHLSAATGGTCPTRRRSRSCRSGASPASPSASRCWPRRERRRTTQTRARTFGERFGRVPS